MYVLSAKKHVIISMFCETVKINKITNEKFERLATEVFQKTNLHEIIGYDFPLV